MASETGKIMFSAYEIIDKRLKLSEYTGHYIGSKAKDGGREEDEKLDVHDNRCTTV